MPPHDKLHGLQILRFVAALMVVFGHAIPLVAANGSNFPAALQTPLLGRIGVDIFFLVSGFIMMRSNAHLFGVAGAIGPFLTRRFIRLFPIYWLFCVVAIAVVLVGSGKGVACNVFAPGYVLASFAMVASLRCDGLMLPLVAQGWTLHYELLFYLIVATSLLLKQKPALVYVVSLILALSLIGRIIDPTAAPPKDLVTFYTNPIMIFFALGAMCGVYYGRLLRVMRLRASPALTALAILVMCLVLVHALRAAMGHYPAFAVSLTSSLTFLGGILSVPDDQDRPFGSMIGDATYSLYLIHNYVLTFMKKVWAALDLWAYPVAYLAVAPIVVVLAGLVVHIALEKPMILFFRAKAAQKAPVEFKT